MNIIEAARLIKDKKLVTRKKWKNKLGYDPQRNHLNEILYFIKEFVINDTYWANDHVEEYLLNHIDNLLAEDWEEIK